MNSPTHSPLYHARGFLFVAVDGNTGAFGCPSFKPSHEVGNYFTRAGTSTQCRIAHVLPTLLPPEPGKKSKFDVRVPQGTLEGGRLFHLARDRKASDTVPRRPSSLSQSVTMEDLDAAEEIKRLMENLGEQKCEEWTQDGKNLDKFSYERPACQPRRKRKILGRVYYSIPDPRLPAPTCPSLSAKVDEDGSKGLADSPGAASGAKKDAPEQKSDLLEFIKQNFPRALDSSGNFKPWGEDSDEE